MNVLTPPSASVLLRRVLIVLGGLIAVVSLPAWIAFPAWTATTTVADPNPEATSRLAERLSSTTESLQALATAMLGLIGFLFSDKVSRYWATATDKQRRAVVAGAMLLAASILTGLVTQWAITSAFVDGTVYTFAARLVGLQAIQAAELGAGTALIAAVGILTALRRDISQGAQ